MEDCGDEGDSFDYSYPTHDMCIHDDLEDAQVTYTCCDEMDVMHICGTMMIPADLKMRKQCLCTSELTYNIEVQLAKDSERIELKESLHNQAQQHRVRFVVKSTQDHTYSYAGTQFGYIARKTDPKELSSWRDDHWFEEPSPTSPLLNHVSMNNDTYTTSIHTRSSKEYELIKKGKQDCSFDLMGLLDIQI